MVLGVIIFTAVKILRYYCSNLCGATVISRNDSFLCIKTVVFTQKTIYIPCALFDYLDVRYRRFYSFETRLSDVLLIVSCHLQAEC